MFEIFSNFFILYGKKWKKKGKESYAFMLSHFCFVFLNFISRNVKVPGLSFLINKLLLQEISPAN